MSNMLEVWGLHLQPTAVSPSPHLQPSAAQSKLTTNAIGWMI